MFLSASDLTLMRADVANMLPDTAIWQTVTWTSGAGGEQTPGTAIAGTEACRIDPLPPGGRDIVGNAEVLALAYQLTFPWDSVAAVGMQVSIGGTVFQVRELTDMHSWRVSTRVKAVRIE